jgi:hypothetical protein
MLLFKTFVELTDAEVTADPLVLLPCGHLFTTSTLDGHMAMADAYERKAPSTAPAHTPAGAASSSEQGCSSSSGQPTSSGGGSSSGQQDSSCHGDPASELEPWGAPIPRSDFPPPKGCPDCRQLVAGVRRYGRVVQHSLLGMTQRKHAEAVR